MTINLEKKETEQFEEWINFGLERYHKSWRDSWGKTILSSELREAIGESRRLTKKIQENILQEVSLRVLSNRKNDCSMPFSEMTLVSSYIEKAGDGFIRQVGLAWHANTIREFLNGAEAHALMELLGPDTLRNALFYQDDAPLLNLDIRVQDLGDCIEKDGLMCCLHWVRQFPDYAAAKLAVLLPKPQAELNFSDEIDNAMIKVVNMVLSPNK